VVINRAIHGETDLIGDGGNTSMLFSTLLALNIDPKYVGC
jgi:hypothetical protein